MQSHDWRNLATDAPAATRVDPRRRLRFGLLLFVLLVAGVYARIVFLERSDGEAFRVAAARPLLRERSLPGVRGRILARDGSVLAHEEQLVALAVHYRYLQDPPHPRWLRATARARLTRSERSDAQRVAREETHVLQQREALHARLADLCGLSLGEWKARASRVQLRVAEISRQVNRRRQAAKQASTPANPLSESLWQRWRRQLTDALWLEEDAFQPILVAEELDAHVMAQGLPLEVVAEVEAQPDRYPGVQIVYQSRRSYPQGALAAHVLGHLGAAESVESPALPEPTNAPHPDDRVGRMGLEQRYESLLRGRRGTAVETVRRNGELISQSRLREPVAGRDLVLTLDPQLQRTAESLLDSACQRRSDLIPGSEQIPAGGAVVVMDVHHGAILAAASAPRFDPNVFAAAMPAHATRQIALLLEDPRHPLFDRALKMALPPGSVFKPLTAVALLESGLDPAQAVTCRGYLHHPDAQRCFLFTRYGIGHNQVTLADALAQSCNVYFFRTAGELGLASLSDWARRFGFGRATGVDLPGEAAGQLPQPSLSNAGGTTGWRVADTQAFAIGQSSLTATPLQIARLMAAVANGGRLVTPHLVDRLGLTENPDRVTDLVGGGTEEGPAIPPPQPIPGLDASTLAAVQEGLRRVVADDAGTAHSTVFLEDVAIAGKTGTAETGGGREDHAWFAGYCPADAPKVALVVVLEHAGGGGAAAGPVAQRLVERMQALGYFKRRNETPRRNQRLGMAPSAAAMAPGR